LQLVEIINSLAPQDPGDEPASILLERFASARLSNQSMERASVVAKKAATETGKRRRGKRT